MDKKQEIINEYLLGESGYRILSKKHGISRSVINRWVMDFQGRERSRSSALRICLKIEFEKYYVEKCIKKLSLN